MKELLKTAGVAAFVALLVVVGVRLVGNQSVDRAVDALGAAIGMNRYPNSGMAARCFTTNATTTSACTDGTIGISGELTVAGLRNTSTSFMAAQNFDSNGGTGIFTIATSATLTNLTGAQICQSSIILDNPGVNSSTIYFATSSAIISSCLNGDGAFKDLYIRNATTTTLTAGRILLYAGDASTTFGNVSSTPYAASSSAVGGGRSLWFRITNVSSSQGTLEISQINN